MLSKEDLIDLLLTDVEAFNQEMGGAPVDLTETDFSGVNIEGAIFDNADLSSSSFSST